MNRDQTPTGCPWWSESQLRYGLREHGGINELASAWDVHQSTLRDWARRHGIDLEEP